MSAQLRLALDDQRTAMLDAMRGLATRTRYADYLLRWALAVGGPAGYADALDRAELRPQTDDDLRNPAPYPAHTPKRRQL